MSGSTNRIVYIEPNDFLGGKTRYSNDLYDTNTIQTNTGAVGDNVTLLNEDLTMSVDLQVVIPDRGGIVNEGKTTILFNSYNENTDGDRYISLMSGKPITVNGVENTFNELTTDYTVASYHELRSNGQGDTESLCIKDISIKFDSHFYPRVTMTMVDVRGYALMMPTEDVYREYISEQMNITPETKTKSSFFRSLFRLPYPRFILTIKGYYGKPVTFNLTVSSFKSAFDSVTGDFNIIIDFIGNVYGLYSDIPFNLLVIAPYIGVASKNIDITDKNTLLRNYGPFWENMSTNGSLYYCGEDRNKRILTFTEYLRSMTNLKEMDHTNAESKSDEENVKFYTDVRSAISDIISLYNELYDSNNFKNVFYDNVRTSFFTRNGYRGIAVFLIDNEDKGYIDVSGDNQTVKNLKAKIKECNAKFGKDKRINEIISEVRKFNSSFSELFPLASFLNESKLYISNGDPLGFKGCNSYDDWKRKDIAKGYTLDNFNEVFSSGLNGHKYGLVKTADMPVDILTDVLNSLTQKITNFNNNRDQRYNSNMLNFLGFKPNIRNMFRMVFAHMSAFTDSFYNLLYTIKDNRSKRLIRNLVTNSTGSVKMENTDIINYDEDDALAPFPLIYDEDENGIQVIQYPGNSKIDMLRDLDEVKYIEDIIKSIHMSKAEIDAALYDSVYASEIAFAGQLRALEERLRRDMANIRPVVQNFNYHYNNYGGGGGGRGEVASNPRNVSTFPFIPQDLFVTGNNYREGWIRSNKDATKLFIHRIIIWIKSHYFIDSKNQFVYAPNHFKIDKGKIILTDKGKEILWKEFRRMREGTFGEIDLGGIDTKRKFNFGNSNACFLKYYVNKSIQNENYNSASGLYVNSDDKTIKYYDDINPRNYTYTSIFKANGNGAYGNFGGSELKESLGLAFFNGVVIPKKGQNIDSKVRAIFYKSFPKYTYYPISDLIDFYNKNKGDFAEGNKKYGYCFSYSGVATIGSSGLKQLGYSGSGCEKVRPRFYDFTVRDYNGNDRQIDVFDEMRKFYTLGQFDNNTYIAPFRNNLNTTSVHNGIKELFSGSKGWMALRDYYHNDGNMHRDIELENFLAGGKSGVLLFTLPQLCYWHNCYKSLVNINSNKNTEKIERIRERLDEIIKTISDRPFARKWLDAAINKGDYEKWHTKYDVETKRYFGIEGLKELDKISKNDGNKERHELLSTMFAIVIMPRTKSSTVLDLSDVYEFMKKELKTNASLN